MIDTALTSTSHPLRVDWLPVGPGKVGLTMAPGKHQRSMTGATWRRDLRDDMQRLRRYWRADRLVSLLTPPEYRGLAISNYLEIAQEHDLAVERFPIDDGGVPTDPEAFAALIGRIQSFIAAGEVVVIHCAGGLGRAGTTAGCLLRASGFSARAALEVLAGARGLRCPENDRQKAFVRAFPQGSSRWQAGNSSDRNVSAVVLGAAIGDAMGHPTEFMSMAQIRQTYGPDGVEGFELWWNRDGAQFAPYTDDTQMAEAVLRALVEGRAEGLDLDGTMRRMADKFVSWERDPQGGHRAPGNACRAGCRALAAGTPWREAGAPMAGGCGSVMRAYPFGLLFVDDEDKAILWAAEHSRLTHGFPDAIAACTAMAAGVVRALRGDLPEDILAGMVAAAHPYSPKVATAILTAWRQAVRGTSPDEVLEHFEGWSALTAIAAGAYVFARHPDDPRAAILQGANSPGDSDSIATLAGALTAARNGLAALPADWVRDVERSSTLFALAHRVGG